MFIEGVRPAREISGQKVPHGTELGLKWKLPGVLTVAEGIGDLNISKGRDIFVKIAK